ncbi:transcriptional regulator [Pluralibacter gergoviae]|uniref:helix-turn-helix domain-containing protein n=1 Tax=Pluralibacter gergoviae TaxID=61647 RepID=UPI0006522C50|nr:helix-turn-helix transcriptional regulator [Pluralibacter gergoviae]KMK28953.1 transcriptional regulator [Pluralibacter gergoviae]
MKISIGVRLREERERLGLSQVAMGEIAGIRKQTQLKYEKGDSSPDATYLAALSKFGLDVLYVVLGIRSAAALTEDEEQLLASYRVAPLAIKAAAVAALTAGTASADSISVSGHGNRVAGRDYNENKK